MCSFKIYEWSLEDGDLNTQLFTEVELFMKSCKLYRDSSVRYGCVSRKDVFVDVDMIGWPKVMRPKLKQPKMGQPKVMWLRRDTLGEAAYF